MKISYGEYEFDDDKSRLDLELVTSWLTTSYWNQGTTLEKVTRATEHSAVVLGAYQDGRQVAFMRVVSDCIRFAWLCDVWVDEPHRGKGLAKAMVQSLLDHPELVGMRMWILATKDAHEVYRSVGFEELPNPERFMVRLPKD